LCALPGAALGAYVGTKVGGVWFNRILAGVMLAVLLLMWQKRKGGGEREKTSSPAKPERILPAHLLMTAAGFYGGFIQAGVGFILMAILHRVLSLDLVRVNMHKVFIIGTYTCVALAIFAFREDVRWIQGGILALGNAAGGWAAARMAIRKGERLIRWIFNALLVAMAIKLLFYY
jgi:uncharacterized membrane protein YfcA